MHNFMWRKSTGTTPLKSSKISHIREIKLHQQSLITPEASKRATAIITNSRWERKALTLRMQSREDTAAKETLAEGLKLFSSQQAAADTGAVSEPYCMRFSGSGFCETLVFLHL